MCATFYGEYKIRDMHSRMERIKAGMDFSEVEAIIGEPDSIHTCKDKQYWNYYRPGFRRWGIIFDGNRVEVINSSGPDHELREVKVPGYAIYYIYRPFNLTTVRTTCSQDDESNSKNVDSESNQTIPEKSGSSNN